MRSPTTIKPAALACLAIPVFMFTGNTTVPPLPFAVPNDD